MAFRVAGLCAAVAIALLIAAAGAQGPQAQEGTDLQDQATGSGQPTTLEQIVFASTRDNPTGSQLRTLELYRMNFDGTNPLRLTNNDSSEAFPAAPLDGKRIVFDSNRLGLAEGKPTTSDLFVMATDGDEEDPIKETYLLRGSSAGWSPDSKNIAYHASASGTNPQIFPGPGAATTDSDIFALNVDDRIENNAEPINLTHNGNTTIDDDADWSPDGKTIIFTSFPGTEPKPGDSNDPVPTREIYAMNADGTGEWTNLTNNNLEERGPAWSPDGKHIVFSCRRPSSLNGNSIASEICVKEVDRDSNGNITGASNEVVLTKNMVADLSASWTSSGDKIVFQRPVGGRTQIFVMDAKDETTVLADGSTVPGPDGTGDNLKQLTNAPGIQFAPKVGVLRVHK